MLDLATRIERRIKYLDRAFPVPMHRTQSD